MAASLVTLGAAALTCATSVLATVPATQQAYQIYDSYNSSNFFDRFNFFVVRITSP